MKKTILLVIFSAAFVFNGFSQSTGFGSFTLGPYAAVPLQNMRPLLNQGFGGSLAYEYNLSHNVKALKKFPYFNNKVFIALEGGYEVFGVKTALQNAFVPSTYGYVPVKAGIKYYPIWGLFAEYEAGQVVFTQHGGGRVADFTSTVGYSFRSGFELGVRFEQWKQTPENHIMGDYGQSGPFPAVAEFKQLAVRLAQRF